VGNRAQISLPHNHKKLNPKAQQPNNRFKTTPEIQLRKNLQKKSCAAFPPKSLLKMPEYLDFQNLRNDV
jgi:hypothetical protein